MLLLVVLIGNLGFRIWQYRQEYLTKFDPDYWQDRYLKSQWVDPQSKEPIGDDGLFAYAGWEYIHGADPTLINAETPPLGKYLIGLSILIFRNQNIFALLTGILVLFIFYKLNFFFFKEKIWALLPVVLFSLEPLYYQQLRAPYLDNLYLLFLISTFYFLLKEKLLISTIFLGLMATTKNTVSTLLLVGGVCSIYVFLTRRESLTIFLKSLLISLLVLFLTYFRYFWLGHSFRDFLGVQKWILNFYTIGAKGTLGMVFPMLVINRWQTWWDGVVKISEWQATWPILLVASSWYLVSRIRRKKRDQLLLPFTWIVIYLAFLSFIPVWPRYFLLLLPFMYTLGVSNVQKIFKS